jgi:hypothetical protein
MNHLHRIIRLASRGGSVSALILVAGLAGAEAADGVCDGTISGQALRALPADTAFDVEVYDNSDANLALRDRLNEKLRAAGRPVADRGPLMISVTSERLFPRFRPDTRAVGTPTTQATTDQLGVNRTRKTIEQLERAPQERPSGAGGRYEEQVEVRFEVRDATTRQFVWLGQLTCSPLTEDRSAIVDAVLDAFVATVGKTVSDEPL